jgi:hypothetical protein
MIGKTNAVVGGGAKTCTVSITSDPERTGTLIIVYCDKNGFHRDTFSGSKDFQIAPLGLFLIGGTQSGSSVRLDSTVGVDVGDLSFCDSESYYGCLNPFFISNPDGEHIIQYQ